MFCIKRMRIFIEFPMRSARKRGDRDHMPKAPSSGFLSHDGFSAELGMLLSAFGLLPVLTRMMPR